MERQRGRAGLDEPRADRRGSRASRREAAPHLHRDRDVDGIGDGRDDPAGELGIVEQRRARAGLRHLADGAAEVDVDDVGARGLDHARRVGHRVGVGAEDLDRQRMLVGGDAQVAERLLVAVLDARRS